MLKHSKIVGYPGKTEMFIGSVQFMDFSDKLWVALVIYGHITQAATSGTPVRNLCHTIRSPTENYKGLHFN